ncbi:hypothetical protein [Streptomyces sp. NPDC006335]|uniref:hypothetical protein n=1 Tax=Streptomyces sp. NPDC006335 TaxID=3156895 RepID=UPI00339E3358
MDSHDVPSVGITNPNHPVPDHVQAFFRQLDISEREQQAQQFDASRMLDPTDEDQQDLIQIWETAAEEMGVSSKTIQRFHDLHGRRRARADQWYVSHGPGTGGRPTSGGLLVDPLKVDWSALLPQDNKFWWAETKWYGAAAGVSINLTDRGLTFSGGPRVSNGDVWNFGCGFTAIFELQPERRPATTTGRWQSAPFADARGVVRGHAGNQFGVDEFAKCWRHTDQTLVQFIFGGEKLIPRGHAHEVAEILNVEATSNTIDDHLIPYQPFPGLTIREEELPYPDQSIWARLKLDFHMQLKGAGSWIVFDWDGQPPLLMYTPQWPLVGDV